MAKLEHLAVTSAAHILKTQLCSTSTRVDSKDLSFEPASIFEAL
jgi:hypothetical protein